MGMGMILTVFKEKTILLLEEDDELRLQTAETLRALFKRVLVAKDSIRALIAYESSKPDIILAGISISEKDGLYFIKHIREKDYVTPIIAIADGNEQEVLISLVNLSADGYLTKPYVIDSVIDAIKIALKRNKPSETLVTLGKDIYYNYTTREVYEHGIPIVLGNKEHSLFRMLLENHPKTISKDEVF